MSQKQSEVAIVGGGVMGGDVAIIFAAGGWNAHVMSPSQGTREALPARLAAGVRKLGAPEANASNVRTYADLGTIPWQDVDLVVEAATENLPLKHKLFAELERLARPDIPFASNTSTFPIGDIGKHLKTRPRVAGLHFFMPAHLVPLVEVIYPHLHNEKAPPPLLKEMVGKGHFGLKTKRGFWEWTDEKIAKERARIERCLQAGMEILNSDADASGKR